jgi:exosortase A-associated hydrolase 2
MTVMNESPFFFGNDNSQLFGLLHRPRQPDVKDGFIFCHPFAEEKLWTHRVFVNFARRLADRGFAVLRFDFTGNGDSEGEFADLSLETYVSDVRRAYDTLLEAYPNMERVSLLGLRFGAMIAWLAADRLPGLDRLILWDPVIKGASYMQEVLRTNLTTQMATYGKVIEKREQLVEKLKSGDTVNVDGYELGHQLFQEVSATNLHEITLSKDVNALIVQIGKKQQPIRDDVRRLSEEFSKAAVNHVIEEPFWREIKEFYSSAGNLFEATCNWLDNSDD